MRNMEINIEDLLASKHGIKLTCVDDANNIIGSGLPGVIFAIEDIGKDFFVLHNRVLGETFQKLITYHYPIAIVLPENHGFGERVTELAREHSIHNCVRFCSTIEDAELWMVNTLNNTR